MGVSLKKSLDSAVNVLSQAAVPIVLLSSATSISATGLITGLPTTYPYIPSGVVPVYMFAMAGLTAGFYYARFGGTLPSLTCQLYTDAAGTITPTGITAGPYPGGTAEVILASVTVPGSSMGEKGALRVSPLFSFPSNGNQKFCRAAFGGQNFLQGILTTTASLAAVRTVRNRSATVQVTEPLGSTGSGTSTALMLQLNINSLTDQAVTFTGQVSNAADFIILDGYAVEILPG